MSMPFSKSPLLVAAIVSLMPLQGWANDTQSLIIQYKPYTIEAQSSSSPTGTVKKQVDASKADQVIRELYQSGDVLWAERDYKVSTKAHTVSADSTTSGTTFIAQGYDQPNDPAFNNQIAWKSPTELFPGQHDILSAFNVSDSNKPLRIGVVDSGFHNVSDVFFAQGYNFASEDPIGSPYLVEEFYGPGECIYDQGTSVASVIGATTNNGLGIAGIADADLYAARAQSCGEGYLSDVAVAIRWLANDPDLSSSSMISEIQGNEPVDVINISIGTYVGGSCPTYLQEAIDYAHSEDVVVVASAGDEARSADYYSPANCNNVLTVGSIDRTGKQSDDTNYGEHVNYAALGENISVIDGYGNSTEKTGTAFSASLISGIAGLVMENNEQIEPMHVENFIFNTLETFPKGAVTDWIGQGIVNAFRSVRRAQEVFNDDIPLIRSVTDNVNLCERQLYDTASERVDGPTDLSPLCARFEVNSDLDLSVSPDANITVFEHPTQAECFDNPSATFEEDDDKEDCNDTLTVGDAQVMTVADDIEKRFFEGRFTITLPRLLDVQYGIALCQGSTCDPSDELIMLNGLHAQLESACELDCERCD